MPKLTPEQEDAVFEAISRQLSRINRVVKGMFGQDMTDDELRRAHGRVMQGVNQAIRQRASPSQPSPVPTPGAPSASALIQRQDGGP